ncbi:MAG: penicillin-binding protein 2 [Coriobacteriia bacterium]|nr:penicillin-binding protein 2 [Coriobacteriia bacterium]
MNNKRAARPSGAGAASFSDDSLRIYIILGVFALLVLGLFSRLAYVQLVAADDYADSARNSRTSVIKVTPRRGTIYDRNGTVLAISVDATTIYANPSEITDLEAETAQIASVLGGTPADYQKKIAQGSSSFAYVKRQADVKLAEQIKAMDLDGIYFLEDTRREYPCGQVGGQVVGFCNLDGVGVAGLELQYDELLSGTTGKVVAEYGRNGIPIPDGVGDKESSVDGQDIVVSIDVVMQEAMERILEDYTEQLGVDTGSVLVDGKTGEIFAAASTPLFNPADSSKSKPDSTVLKPLTKSFEPGSVFKAVTSLKLLETRTMNPKSKLYCPAEIEADGYKVTDSHERPAETMTLRKIMADSSNIGVSLSTEKMGFDKLNQAIDQYGLKDATGVDFPGEPDPIVPDFSGWSRIQGYNISFGQGITQTPLQMARFYGALTNGGVACTPHFLVSKPQSDETVKYEKTKIIDDKKALKNQISLLKAVVEEGTGTPGHIEGYHVAGKTGTAEVASDQGGYKKGIYNISFIGFLAESTSSLVCYTGAYELDAEGNVSPIFKDIMQEAIERYNIVSK